MGTQLQYQVAMPTAVANVDEFLQATQELLTNVVLNWSYLLVPAQHRPNIDVAWQAIDYAGAQAECVAGDLAEVGLDGPQLALKMSASPYRPCAAVGHRQRPAEYRQPTMPSHERHGERSN